MQTPSIALDGARVAWFRAAQAHPHPLLDLGILELSPDSALALGVEWIAAPNATSRHMGPRALVCVAGFPSELLNVPSAAPLVVVPTPFMYFSEVSTRLPDPQDVSVPMEEAIDFFVEYEQRNILAVGGDRLAIHPRGMSGCGVFIVPRPVPGQIWSPQGIELAGIQSSFVPAAQLLRANRIEYVFDLIKGLRKDSVKGASA